MALNTPFNEERQQVAEEHRQWLQAFDPQYLINWNRLLRNDNEAAMTEAVVRGMLQQHEVTVEPNESLSGDCGGPDFRCTARGSLFYVEATCISIEAAERHLNAKELGDGCRTVDPYGMTEAVFRECQGKAPQCSNLNGPALVAIGTWNADAARNGFSNLKIEFVLTGKTKFSWIIDTSTGRQVGEHCLTTELQAAAFLRLTNTQTIAFARNSISGLLLCSCDSMKIVGVLHPNPVRPFAADVLPSIEFGAVEVDPASEQLNVIWQGGVS